MSLTGHEKYFNIIYIAPSIFSRFFGSWGSFTDTKEHGRKLEQLQQIWYPCCVGYF